MHTHTRFAWLRLNADGLLLAGFALLSGFDLLNPELHDLAQAAGYVPWTFYLWSVLYILGGLGMVLGFYRHRMQPELAGRSLIACAGVMETWRTATILGWTDDTTVRLYVGLVFLLGTFALRASALLSKRGVAIIIGGHAP